MLSRMSAGKYSRISNSSFRGGYTDQRTLAKGLTRFDEGEAAEKVMNK